MGRWTKTAEKPNEQICELKQILDILTGFELAGGDDLHTGSWIKGYVYKSRQRLSPGPVLQSPHRQPKMHPRPRLSQRRG
jgi:hypothetical protein